MIPPHRLCAFQEVIGIKTRTGHNVDFNKKVWLKYFADQERIVTLIERYSPTITRSDLEQISVTAISENTHLDTLFLATMIWGFGKRGNPHGSGAKITSEMFKDQNISLVVSEVVKQIKRGDIPGAYNFLLTPRPIVRYLGQSFATKLLYTVGLGLESIPSPLILDRNVAKSLTILAQDQGHPPEWYAQGSEGYGRYVNDMHYWSTFFKCKADSIELFLFEIGREKPPSPYQEAWQTQS
jgi:hypothetical protein